MKVITLNRSCSADQQLTLNLYTTFIAELMKICKEYYARLQKLHSEKYDLEHVVTTRDFEVREIASKVNDVRGRL
jgi:uncharacterized protein YqiB (DUF1249 family)